MVGQRHPPKERFLHEVALVAFENTIRRSVSRVVSDDVIDATSIVRQNELVDPSDRAVVVNAEDDMLKLHGFVVNPVLATGWNTISGLPRAGLVRRPVDSEAVRASGTLPGFPSGARRHPTTFIA